MRALIALALVLPVAACGGPSWPDEGAGGMAEVARPTHEPRTPPADLRRHLDCSLRAFARVSETARGFGHFTGQVAELEYSAAHVQREAVGGLPEDARVSLVRFDRGTAALAEELQLPPPDLRSCLS